jgi:hypothetical protein
MTWWRWQKIIRAEKPRVFGDDAELNIALAGAADENPIWRAVHQLIDTAEENAVENAGANMDPPTVLAGYVGGAGHLRMLRDELHSRRQLGIEQMRARQTSPKAARHTLD